jgi:hypothetical protein
MLFFEEFTALHFSSIFKISEAVPVCCSEMVISTQDFVYTWLISFQNDGNTLFGVA